MAALRILLGDDHTRVRRGIRKILEEKPDWEVVAETSDGRAAVREALAVQPDVAILDIGMPLLNGIDSTQPAGKSFFSAAVAEMILHDHVCHLSTRDIVDRFELLSKREREIFQLIGEAHSNKAIANLLSISLSTVETHRAHILQKLHLHHTAELVSYARRKAVIS